MNGRATYLRRGLLALALVGVTSACGDDDEGDELEDAGVDAGPDGGGHGGRGGGAADAGNIGPPTLAACVAETTDNTQGARSQECIQCACERAVVEAVACNESCWSMIACYALNCAAVPGDDMNAAAACAGDKCKPFKNELIPAMNLGAQLADHCPDECVMTLPQDDDAGIDAGI